MEQELKRLNDNLERLLSLTNDGGKLIALLSDLRTILADIQGFQVRE